ncbi:MAG: hypothetical protein M1482_00180 [Chloroflexi bacterium]|nr:hypothetical protein [Chloroflexota bacterium]
MQTSPMLPPSNALASRGALQPAAPQADISGWETCEITFETNSRSSNRFIASAVGPSGAYEAGRSEALTGGAFFEILDDLAGVEKQGPSPEVERNVKVLHALVAQLVEEGWEPTEENGQHWWSVRFKRKTR